MAAISAPIYKKKCAVEVMLEKWKTILCTASVLDTYSALGPALLDGDEAVGLLHSVHDGVSVQRAQGSETAQQNNDNAGEHNKLKKHEREVKCMYLCCHSWGMAQLT